MSKAKRRTAKAQRSNVIKLAPLTPDPGPRATGMKVRPSGFAGAKDSRPFSELFPVAPPPPGVPQAAQMAMDDAMAPFFDYAQVGMYGEGVTWPGFPYLAELTQRPEYRMITEVRAKEMTRKGFELTYTGEDETKAEDKLAELERGCEDFRVNDRLRVFAEHDGFFGGAQIYIDTGDTDKPDELKTPLVIDKAKIPKGKLNGFINIEPMWSYPGTYNSTDPLKPNYFKPDQWYVNGKTVHRTRLLTGISREMPDILKPAYSFRGLSLSQMAKPYVDNWLRTRQSVSDLLHSFSIIVLASNLQGQLGGDPWTTIYQRVDEFNALRDNRGAFVIDKETEEMVNLAVPLGTLDALQAQAQEQMASVSQTPLVKLLGITPSGLNACLTGETLILTNRGQVPIRDVTLADLVMTRRGWAPLTFSGVTKHATELFEIRTESATLRCTGNHPIWNASTNEFVPAENVVPGQRLLLTGEKAATPKTRLQWSGVVSGGGSGKTVTTPPGMWAQSGPFFFIEEYGKRIAALFLMGSTSIMSIATRGIINSLTLSRCMAFSTPRTTISTSGLGVGLSGQNPFFARTADHFLSSKNFQAGKSFAATNASLPTGGPIARLWTGDLFIALASCVGRVSTPFGGMRNFARVNARPPAGRQKQNICERIFSRTPKNSTVTGEGPSAPLRAPWLKCALDAASSLFRSVGSINYTARTHAKTERGRADTGRVISVRKIPANEPVYDLTVAKGHLPEFFANGILTHNSSDGEIRVFYDTIAALQEHLFKDVLRTMLDCIQLHLWGDVDEDIGFKFVPLWQLDEAAEASVRKSNADTDAVYIDAGVLSPEDVRGMLVADKDSPYAGLDPDDLPEPPDMGELDDSGNPANSLGESKKDERSGV